MESSRKFIEKIREKEIKLFPEFKNSNSNFEIDPLWVYFAPSWHIKAGLLNEEDLDKIINEDKTLLSVGAGGAYLEQLLVSFGVSIKNILISDIDYSSMPKQFERVSFDMFEDWDVLDGMKFDYIIFPESIFVFLKNSDEQMQAYFLASLMEKALKHLKLGGILRFSWGSKLKLEIEKAFNFLLQCGRKFDVEIFDNAFGLINRE